MKYYGKISDQKDLVTKEYVDDNAYVLPVAGTAIGGVKSGTDITVDSAGNVSVKDDSHNHVISNIDSLQTTLDGKATNSHTHTATTSSPSGTTSVLTSVKSAGAVPTLGTAIAADDITDWSAGSGSYTQGTFNGGSGSLAYTCDTSTIASAGALVFNHIHTAATHGADSHIHSAPSLSYTARSIPNVTAVGSMPTFNSGSAASTAHTHTLTTSAPTE